MGQFTILLMVLGVFSLSLIATSTSKVFVNTIGITDRPDEIYVDVVESNVVKSGDRRETDASVAAVAMTNEIDEHNTTQPPEPMPTKSPPNSPSNTPSSPPRHSATRKPRESAAKLPPPPLLSYDWTNMTVYSDQAKAMYAHQHNCSIPWIRYDLRKLAMGLGSELHVWSYVLNESMRFRGYRVLTHVPPRDPHRPRHEPSWDWLDHKACGDPFHISQLDCYFPGAEPNCGVEQTTEWANMSIVQNQISPSPNTEDTVMWRAASMEYLFSNMSTLVVDEAERQARAVFGKNGTMEDPKVPRDLILVHMRWGDKFVETKLLSVEAYISAVQRVVGEQNLTEVNILLCTEDPAAVSNFENRSHSFGWNVYIDHFFTEFEHYRVTRSLYLKGYPEFNVVANVAQDLEGKPGLWAIGSVLVAMESKYYILTLSSNWSRLYNELRKNIVDPRCDNCTVMVDLGGGGEF